jgi:2-oxo-3-hexenedioate decarboxylase
MSESLDAAELQDVAADVIGALRDRRQIPPFSETPRAFGVKDAFRLTPLLRADMEARGEKVVGRKIGFSNRELWPVYGVTAPIWGYCVDRTTQALAATSVQSVGAFVEPRLEPEIMFGLAKAPSVSMDAAALLDCVAWIALGFEVVQSIYPDWRFQGPDTIAANALHGSLLIGDRQAIAPPKAEWARALETFRIELFCDDELAATGGGANVLDSPLRALGHLVGLLDADPENPPLAPGEIVSTGTLTLAMPVSAGETWTTKVSGIPLPNVSLRFEA